MADILKDANGLWLKDNFFDYQWRGHRFQCSMAASALWVPMSGGKTIMTLSSIVHLQQSDNWLGPVLVVGPKRVVQTVWHIEAAKWQHTRHLRFSTILGDVQQRTRALATPAHVYLTNYENLKWLAGAINRYYLSRGHAPPFNGVVFDELTKMKNASTNRVTEFRKILPYMKWRTGLTGTPAGNGYVDLHGQYLVLDDGARLGSAKTHFTERFCVASGYMGYGSRVTEQGEQEIRSLISDMTFYLAEEEVAKLPDLIVHDIEVPLTGVLREKYDAFERDMFIELESGAEIEVFNAAAKTNKCLQFSNGAVYLQSGQPESEVVHDLKLDALEDIVEEAAGAPVLVAYNFRTDAARIMERFKALKPINLTESKDPAADIAKWKAGEARMMIGHPACLHPRTEVLTETRGWVRIVDVKSDERVFDGVEFVQHGGVSYSGFSTVVDVFGITMTPEHRLLVGGEWVEAQHAGSNSDSRRAALYEYEGDDEYLVSMLTVRGDVPHTPAERAKAQPTRRGLLRRLYSRLLPSADRHPDLADLARAAGTGARLEGQELRGAWDQRGSGVGQFRAVLCRHVAGVLRRADNRARGRERPLLKSELHLGHADGTASEQAQQPRRHLLRGDDAPGRALPSVWPEQDEAGHAAEPRDDGGRGCGRRDSVSLRERASCARSAHVFDLVNCGPRSRFLIRNSDGEVFVSHNSMGHGIDGLQDRGNILVWFGLGWSLELYLQFNGRLRRQNAISDSVRCYRILVPDTLDMAVRDAIEGKARTEDDLKRHIHAYQKSRGL